MPIPNREQHEQRLARLLSRYFGDQRRRIAEILLDTPELDQITPAQWSEYENRLALLMEPEFDDLFILGELDLEDALRYSLDPILTGNAASEFAVRYSGTFAQGITQTSQNRLRSVMTRYFERQLDNAWLTSQLTGIFGPVRAEMAAITEVTRVAVEGREFLARRLRNEGVELITVWMTRNDERVCPVCGPRHDQPQGSNWYTPPPAHPRCRCDVNYRVPEPTE